VSSVFHYIVLKIGVGRKVSRKGYKRGLKIAQSAPSAQRRGKRRSRISRMARMRLKAEKQRENPFYMGI
jgi:hypothetical protein